MDRYKAILKRMNPDKHSPTPESCVDGNQLYGGWICARVGDEKTLRNIGVTGEIKLNNAAGVYEYCDITKDVGLALKKMYGNKIFLGAFSAIDSEGNCLPPDKQFFYGKD